MPDYSKSKIYVLRRADNNAIFYCGSTTAKLWQRLVEHKKYSRVRNYPVYRYVRENDIRITIELVEEFPCNTKQELHKREGEHTKELMKHWKLYNCSIAGRQKQEYIEDNYELYLARKRHWKNKKFLKNYQPKVKPTKKLILTLKISVKESS